MNDLMISWFHEAPPLQCAMGSDWLAGPVYCDSLNCLVRIQKCHAPHLRMCSGCIVNNGVVNIAYHFEPDWYPENISEEDRVEPVQAQLLQDISEWYVSLFVVVSCF